MDLRNLTRVLVGRAERLAARGDEVATQLAYVVSSGHADLAVDYWAREGVLALAIDRARSIGAEAADWDEAEAQMHAHAHRAQTVHDLTLMQVDRAFRRNEIDFLPIKGVEFARRLYGRAELRAPSVDLDILVRPDALKQGSEILQQLGWTAPIEELYEGGLPNRHLNHRRSGGVPSIELHWRVQWYERDTHTEWIMSTADRTSGPIAMPSPCADLSIALLSWVRDGTHRLRLAADIAQWWDLHEDTIDV